MQCPNCGATWNFESEVCYACGSGHFQEKKQRQVVNLTPHAINVRVDETAGTDRTFPPSGQVCRCQPQSEVDGILDGILVVKSSFGELQGLPAPEEGVTYLVSMPAAQRAALDGRTDVVAPDTGPTAIRNEQGQVIAVRGFQRF